jgi:phenylacetate-coenzyme A ligase PaaK-like adenylate-forming protein
MDPRLLRGIALADRLRLLAEKVALYARDLSPDQIERHQVERFNQTWDYCLREVPFYRAWQQEHSLPDRIGSVAELAAFPGLDKATIVGRADEIFQGGRITMAYSTGGSTGEPTRFPEGKQDLPHFYANSYVGRYWWGIEPFDSNVLLLGDADLLG